MNWGTHRSTEQSRDGHPAHPRPCGDKAQNENELVTALRGDSGKRKLIRSNRSGGLGTRVREGSAGGAGRKDRKERERKREP